MDARKFRKLIETQGKVAAVSQATSLPCENEIAANCFIYEYVKALLDGEKYAAAAIVLWGFKIFNPLPYAVRMVWEGIKAAAKVLLQGSGSVGKSYSCIVWLLLDWLRDPEFTNVKIISTTAGHAKSNTFATMQMLVRNAVIPLPGVALNDYIGLDPKERYSGISIVAIPDGDNGGGVLQGFHPIPRPAPHPTLGDTSRLRALLDECEEIPIGVWQGVDNMLTAIDGTDRIKIIGAYNPKDQSTKTAQNAAPEGGWERFDVDTGVDGKDVWESKNGWHVVRIDAAKTENVKQRKMVFPGFQTYEGYRALADKNGGNSAEYYTFGRGAYPPISAVRIIVQSQFLQGCRGEFIFLGATTKCASVDTAVDGRDVAAMSVGRFGLATAFRTKSGQLNRFPEPRMALQCDQQFPLKKGSTKIVGDDIKAQAIALGIAPEWVMIDATGNGSAVLSYLQAVWSDQVQGLDFGAAATEMKILDQDKFAANELYDGVVTEVWFTMARWMEYGYFAIAPVVRSDPLEEELLGRRYNNVGKKTINGESKEMIRVEKKDAYKVRLSHSPDYADSMTLLVHLARVMGHLMGSMTGRKPQERRRERTQHGVVDRVQWLNDF